MHGCLTWPRVPLFCYVDIYIVALCFHSQRLARFISTVGFSCFANLDETHFTNLIADWIIEIKFGINFVPKALGHPIPITFRINGTLFFLLKLMIVTGNNWQGFYGKNSGWGCYEGSWIIQEHFNLRNGEKKDGCRFLELIPDKVLWYIDMTIDKR
jgi:hypothetical protein